MDNKWDKYKFDDIENKMDYEMYKRIFLNMPTCDCCECKGKFHIFDSINNKCIYCGIPEVKYHKSFK